MKRRRRNSGHLLAEAMMAILMLAVCALIFSATLPAAHNSRAKADNYNIATSLASKMLEEVRNVGYTNAAAIQLASYGLIDSASPVAANTYSFTNVDVGISDSPGSTLPAGTGRLAVEQLGIDLRQVTATVTWTEKGRTNTVSLATLLANV